MRLLWYSAYGGPRQFNTSQVSDAQVKQVKAQLVDLFNK